MEDYILLLTNRSETVLFAGVEPTSYGLKAELGMFLPNAPAEFDLYVAPIKPDSKPLGTFTYPNRQKGWQQTIVEIPLNKVDTGADTSVPGKQQEVLEELVNV